MFKYVFKTKPTISYPPPRSGGRGNRKGKVFFIIIISIGYAQCCCGYCCRLTARRSWGQIPFGALGLLYLQLSFQCRRGSLQRPPTAQTRMWGRVELATDLSCKGCYLRAPPPPPPSCLTLPDAQDQEENQPPQWRRAPRN